MYNCETSRLVPHPLWPRGLHFEDYDDDHHRLNIKKSNDQDNNYDVMVTLVVITLIVMALNKVAERKNGHENFCQARIYYFRDKCVVFACNDKINSVK